MSNIVFREGGTAVVSTDTSGLDEVTRRLLGDNTRNKRISIRGSKFRMIVNGQETARSNNNSMNVVVVNAAPHVSRTYYSKTFSADNVGLPDCWSNDGIAPDAKATAPQSKTCDACPQNVAGSHRSGKGRACSYNRRLAVVLANDIENSDVYQLQLPATSIFGRSKDPERMPLNAYVEHLASGNIPITRVITEMRFDENSEVAKLFFFPVAHITDSNLIAILAEKGASPAAEAAITFNPAQIDDIKQNTAPKIEPEPEPVIRKARAADATVVADEDVVSTLEQWATDD